MDIQDKIEANRGRLRILKEMCREFDRWKQEITKGSSRAKVIEAFTSILHANDPSHHPHHVPFMWACRDGPHKYTCQHPASSRWSTSSASPTYALEHVGLILHTHLTRALWSSGHLSFTCKTKVVTMTNCEY